MQNIDNIFLIGDLHGSINPIESFYNNNKELLQGKNNVLICLGDFGANYYFNHRDKKFKASLCKYPFTYFIIRGNHEERPSICAAKNPDDWSIESFFGNDVYVENDYPYIKYAQDIITDYLIPCGNKFLDTIIIPGAYSADKYYRLAQGWSWFENEQLSQEEMEYGKNFIQKCKSNECDLVLSHTCPLIYEPTDLFLPMIDQSTVDKSMEHFMNQIEFSLDYKAWCWGHFHECRDYPSPDGRRRLMLMHRPVRLEDIMNIDERIKE